METISFTIPKDLLETINSYVVYGKNRSNIIVEALNLWLEQNKERIA